MTRLPEVPTHRFAPIASAPRAWPKRIGIFNDYVRVPYANGSSFASQFLYRSFTEGGHEVTVVGPTDPEATPAELPKNHVCLPSLPLRNHPGVFMSMPTPAGLRKVESLGLDIALGQTGTELASLGVWLRWRQNMPYLAVNTFHLPSVYNVLLPEQLYAQAKVREIFEHHIIPRLERHAASVYNGTDGLVVLSRGLKDYWRAHGVTAPIHVIPRAVDPSVFDRPAGDDPFPAGAKKGSRLLCVCRATREKNVTRLLHIFARHIGPAVPDATLTLVGDGPDYDTFVAEADRLGIGDRVFFMGEQRLTDIPRYYRHADLFVFNSLSETYGQVVSEAMWCGLPVVALDDGMGVAQQVEHGVDGVLVAPGPDESQANWRFAKEVFNLLKNPIQRHALSREAQRRVRQRADPAVCIERYFEAFEEARDHCRATEPLRKRPTLPLAGLLGRWSMVHSATVALGLMRPVATINRNQTRQPLWDDGTEGGSRWRPSPSTRMPTSFVEALGELEATEPGALRRFAASYRLLASSP